VAAVPGLPAGGEQTWQNPAALDPLRDGGRTAWVVEGAEHAGEDLVVEK
jgi:hypothetical protein